MSRRERQPVGSPPKTRTPYDHTWQRVRPQILQRDNYKCQVHGPKCKGVATQVDHIIPLSEGGARLDHDNLRATCSSCNAGRQNTRNAELAKALERPATPSGTPSRNW
jgi:5-methylcytosine-specific restriction enzyme A